VRILILIHEFPPVGGGGGRIALELCKQLAQRGHEIIVLTAHLRGLPRRESSDGFTLIRLASLRTQPYRASFLAMSAYVFAGLWATSRLFRRQRPDVMHVHFAVPAGVLAWVLSRLTGIPYILTAHLGDVPGGVPEKTDQWFEWVLPLTPPIWRRARRVVAVSNYTKQLALKHYPVKITIIPNGEDLTRLRPRELKVNLPVRVVFAGRFMPQKNPVQVVRILEELSDLDWRCAMLGAGPLLKEVRREIDKAGLEDRFDLPGWVGPEEVLDWFSRSDILLMPSLSEGLPVVAVQGLAKGLAMVVSNVGGFADVVENGRNGFLIETMDTKGFAQSLRALISDPYLLMQFRQAGLAKAAGFDIRRVADQYESILQGAANGH